MQYQPGPVRAVGVTSLETEYRLHKQISMCLPPPSAPQTGTADFCCRCNKLCGSAHGGQVSRQGCMSRHMPTTLSARFLTSPAGQSSPPRPSCVDPEQGVHLLSHSDAAGSFCTPLTCLQHHSCQVLTHHLQHRDHISTRVKKIRGLLGVVLGPILLTGRFGCLPGLRFLPPGADLVIH